MRGAFYSFGTRLILMAVNIVTLGITARLVTPAEFGRFTILQLLIGAAGVLPFAVGQALAKIEGRGTVGVGVALVIGMAIASDLALLLSRPFIDAAFRIEITDLEMVLSLAAIPFMFLAFLADAVLRKNFLFGVTAAAESLSQIIGLYILTAVLAVMGFGAASLIIGLFVYSVLWFALLAGGFLRFIDIPRRSALGSFREAGWFSLMGVANYIALNGDNFVVGRMLDPAALGIYSRAYNLMTKPVNLIGSAISNVFFPALVKVRDKPDRLKMAYLKASTAAALCALPGAALACLFAREVVLLVLGEQWTSAILPFQILSIGLFFRIHSKVSEAVAFASGDALSAFWRQAVFAGCVIAASIFGSRWGLVGITALVVAAIALFYGLITLHANARSLTSPGEWLEAIAWPLAATGIASGATLVWKILGPGFYLLIDLLFGSIFFCLIFALVLLTAQLLQPSSSAAQLLLPLVRKLSNRSTRG
jgi:PST family polysaccharide transporter